MEHNPLLDWAVELQSLAQAGLFYSKDVYDIQRFQRIREISAEMVSRVSGLPLEKVTGLFCNETGYQTPKLDSRAAIFRDGKVLLVRENTGLWSLPGGWVDVDQSVKENTIKEAKEEAGLDVTVDRVIAVQDREKHNKPRYIYRVCKIFLLCTAVGGSFTPNIETTESGWFSLEELPPLSEDKCTAEQIKLCFEASQAEHWETQID